MRAEDVVRLYDLLDAAGIAVWIDGGWSVDALLGEQTRDHADLDLAVDRSDAAELRRLLEDDGFTVEHGGDRTEWAYVLSDGNEIQIDVHVFEYDDAGANVYGIAYPDGSLTGFGAIGGRAVRCVAPEWMLRFKTAYEPKPKDIQDVQSLCRKFGLDLPERYQPTPG
jgi:lincosamide nucleotidyltransferase A/C/D/E